MTSFTSGATSICWAGVQTRCLRFKDRDEGSPNRCLLDASPGGLVSLSCLWFTSPSRDPGDFMAQDAAKVDGRFVQRELVDRCPEFQLIAVTAALVAIVPHTA